MSNEQVTDVGPSATGEARPVPDHTVSIPGGRWLAWRTVAVRGAGFPAALIDGMAAPATARAIDACLARGSDGGQVESEVAASFTEEMAAIRSAALRLAADPRFREALAWQNRKILHDSVDRFLTSPGVANQRDRDRVGIIARYLQRYCLKNDTIGFFGPVGWGRLADTGDDLTSIAGPELIARREVFIETWAADALASSLAQKLDLRPWLTPRMPPYIGLEGTSLRVPGREPLDLPVAQARLLDLCRGRMTAREIAARAVADGELGVASEAEAFAMLDNAASLGVVRWSFELPLVRHPVEHAASFLRTIDDEAVRAAALALLEPFLEAKAGVAAAAGDPAAVDAAIARLEDAFTAITGQPATRRGGETYASRTILHEDCRRAAEVTFGPGFLQRVGPPLTLILDSARWVSSQMGARFQQGLDALHAELAGGREDVALTQVLQRFEEVYARVPGRPILAGVERELQARWGAILGLGEGSAPILRSVDDVAQAAAESFRCSGMGWPGAYLTPDLMIAARGVEGVNDGAFKAVLGELHFYNTLRGGVFSGQHDDPGSLSRVMDLDHPGERLVPIESKERGYRLSAPIAPGQAWRLHMTPEPTDLAAGSVIPVSDVVVRRDDRGLRLRTGDGRLDLDLMHLVGAWLEVHCSAGISLVAPRRHTPRITIGDLVVCRERWTCEAAELEFAHTKGSLATFVAARRWWTGARLPRHVFVRVPTEDKPLFVDGTSPVYVDMLAKLVRRAREAQPQAATVVVSEMLPGPEDLWLRDAQGRAYTSELRIVTFAR